AALEEARQMEAAHAPAAAPPRQAPRAAHPAAREGEMSGVCAVPGLAVGRAVRIERREIQVTEQGAGSLHEKAELGRARANVKLRLEKIRSSGAPERQEIID